MEQHQKNSIVINKLCWFFIITGLVEIFLFIFISTNFLAIIPGLITIIPAYMTLNKVTIKRNYFVGIWALIKYNPVSFALLAFILGDFYGNSYNYNFGFITIIVLSYLVFGGLSLVFGIMLIIKISKHNRTIKQQMLDKK